MLQAVNHVLQVRSGNADPVRYRVFYDMYRAIADAAGVPKEAWNARARHGGGTEARASGASIEDTTDHMQKSDMEGTRRDYIAGNVETTRRVARSRMAVRKKTEGYRRAACRLVRSIPSLISPWQASTANSRERNLTGPCTARLPR
ncbi:hypothetical protein [Tardiphaga sp. 841_E9_N1_2]|uniref:hypothetical protein n=1 Tax=Tardiphaga sp. 841_E9_N1_2 TaxID=3240762 RepID=UPI003F29F1E8